MQGNHFSGGAYAILSTSWDCPILFSHSPLVKELDSTQYQSGFFISVGAGVVHTAFFCFFFVATHNQRAKTKEPLLL
jgi:hypothetical protein